MSTASEMNPVITETFLERRAFAPLDFLAIFVLEISEVNPDRAAFHRLTLIGIITPRRVSFHAVITLIGNGQLGPARRTFRGLADHIGRGLDLGLAVLADKTREVRAHLRAQAWWPNATDNTS